MPRKARGSRKARESRKNSFTDKLNFDYKRNKEMYIVIGVMVLLIILFAAFYNIFQSFSSFEYNGLKFTREKIGSTLFYHHSYFYDVGQGKTNQYNLYLRYDPRKNNVPIEGEITFPSQGSKVYISVNTSELVKCNESILAAAGIADFIAGNLFKVVGAVPDRAEANSNNLTYATCGTYPLAMTILLTGGNETKVTKTGKCYIISSSNCEILKAVEKFEVQSILDARERTGV